MPARAQRRLGSIALFLLASAVCAGGDPRSGVRQTDRNISFNTRSGVVTDINENSITVVEVERGKAQGYVFSPIDVLREGKVLPGVFGSHAYRWGDVRKGDTVTLGVLKDDGDQATYCLTISILKRPGAELPQSQDPKGDNRYAAAWVVNELDNGNDVSDEQADQAFPAYTRRKTGKSWPGGLTGPLLDQRTANRELLALRAAASGMAVTPPKDDKK